MPHLMPWAEDRCWRECGKKKKQGFNLVRWCRQRAILWTFSKHTIIETPTRTQLVSVSLNILKWNSTRLRTKASCRELRNRWCSMLFRFSASTWRISRNIPAFKQMKEVQAFWREPQKRPDKRLIPLTQCSSNWVTAQIHFSNFFWLMVY